MIKSRVEAPILRVGVGFAVRLDVVLGGMLGVLGCVDMMTMGKVRVVSGRYMVPSLMMFGGFVVMVRSVLMVLRCLGMMMCSFF